MEESKKLKVLFGAIRIFMLTIFSGGVYAGYLILDGRQNVFAGGCIILLGSYFSGLSLFLSSVAIGEAIEYRKVIIKPSYCLSVFKELGLLYLMAFSYAYGSFNFLKGKQSDVGFFVMLCSSGLIFRLFLRLFKQNMNPPPEDKEV